MLPNFWIHFANYYCFQQYYYFSLNNEDFHYPLDTGRKGKYLHKTLGGRPPAGNYMFKVNNRIIITRFLFKQIYYYKRAYLVLLTLNNAFTSFFRFVFVFSFIKNSSAAYGKHGMQEGKIIPHSHYTLYNAYCS